ncbi:hypothetical protein GFY24_32950 [Nocardia sp. SYP-A9097]|uniref:hypothetical protein n=1 Tax=Nocardia sp. SYP-A9097 TaxID=2663237 RepID=UPI00129BEB77|nr:hypothetical protein [Nocardia sp. SYP-A9097]MRH92188.1 hypothetical protein [Nocardia sp. SYP-A9097]
MKPQYAYRRVNNHGLIRLFGTWGPVALKVALKSKVVWLTRTKGRGPILSVGVMA